MNRKLYFSQKIYLFFIYGLLVIVLLSLFFISFYSLYSKNIYKDAKTKSETLCASVQNSISTELKNMSTVSMNIVYSNAIKKNFTSFTKNNTDKIELDNFFVSRENVLAIYDIITAIIGPFQSASQVNLYTLNGICIGSGYFQGVTNVGLKSIPWYEETMNKNGAKNISTTSKLSNNIARNEYGADKQYLSLTRVFFNSSNEPEGIVEVLQDYNNVFSLISQLKLKNPSTSFYVYNEKNELVYPNSESLNEDINYMDSIKSNNLTPSIGYFVTLGNYENVLITYEKIDAYNWTIVTSEPKSTVFRSLYSFEQGFIILIIFSIFFTLLLCFIISSRLTSPLSKLTKATKKVTISRVLNEKELILTPVNSNIQEISELYRSFLEMYDKLKDSSHEILLLRSEETKAKLQATQSLVNPHFLYNNLTNISIMAEENMNDNIIDMCHALCDYFRYITTNDETAVSLSTEILYTQKYIECMKMRYGEDLIYTCDINKLTENILIPKLIIQPIVENAFKHGFSSSPPWHLNISSNIDENKWLIHIEDNGGCLSKDKKEELLSTFYNLNKDEELKTLKIGGMGIKNVYIRLKLLYNEHAIFKIDNSKDHKTIFTIGGPIYYNKEDFYGNYTQL
ncbi:HAMP domain-containing protein [Clostridium chromiireducens]|uniref:HAMP domain-containing protein n=1 Tax=Clostridium chromiireducens TaxID=225345 RepID=A0A964RK55_9CLOT|nr:sensor histidine kinase [Clostridium chromiireducens]MVX63011.1 HAMP domain-containing protein [Clostridium chromiireducens]